MDKVGEDNKPDLDTAKLVCKWLGVPLAQVLGLTGSDPLKQALSSILSTNPALRQAFEQILEPIEFGLLEVNDLEDILQYIAFRLQQVRGPKRSSQQGEQLLQDN